MASPSVDSGVVYHDLREYAPIEEIIAACRREGATTPASFGSVETFHVRVYQGGLASLSSVGMTYSWTREELVGHWQTHLL